MTRAFWAGVLFFMLGIAGFVAEFLLPPYATRVLWCCFLFTAIVLWTLDAVAHMRGDSPRE